jgi:hypothetical protein
VKVERTSPFETAFEDFGLLRMRFVLYLEPHPEERLSAAASRRVRRL